METKKKTFGQRIKEVGPGAVVAAAFIGPGTVTSCFTSGASYGMTLLWAILFSTISVIIMQTIAARLGIVTGLGLSEALRKKYAAKKGMLVFLAILVVAAVFIGNVAYETGNISGAVLGARSILNEFWENNIWKYIFTIALVAITAYLLWSGNNNKIEKVLTSLVVIMGVLFLICALVSKPDWGAVLRGLFVPTVPDQENAWMTVAALMGTTVVPYNIYLHASSAAKKWNNPEEDIPTSNLDSVLAIGLGGIISLAIIICASAVAGQADLSDGRTMALSLAPLLGPGATVIFGIGLFAAGFSSAITAPLAAAYASCGILGWGSDMKDKRFRLIWIIVLAFGFVATLTLGKSPQEIILFAQAANAFLLPITGILLLIATNDKDLLGKYKNGVVINILAIIVIAVFVFIAARNATAFVQSASKLING